MRCHSERVRGHRRKEKRRAIGGEEGESLVEGFHDTGDVSSESRTAALVKGKFSSLKERVQKGKPWKSKTLQREQGVVAIPAEKQQKKLRPEKGTSNPGPPV